MCQHHHHRAPKRKIPCKLFALHPSVAEGAVAQILSQSAAAVVKWRRTWLHTWPVCACVYALKCKVHVWWNLGSLIHSLARAALALSRSSLAFQQANEPELMHFVCSIALCSALMIAERVPDVCFTNWRLEFIRYCTVDVIRNIPNSYLFFSKKTMLQYGGCC